MMAVQDLYFIKIIKKTNDVSEIITFDSGLEGIITIRP